MRKHAGWKTLGKVIALGALAVSAWAAGAQKERLIAGGTGNQKVVIGEPGGECLLNRKGVRESTGLSPANAKNPMSARQSIPALAVVETSDASMTGTTSRLVVVDMRCRIVQVLKDPYRAPPPMLSETLLTATRSGHLDIQADNGKWGSWNLRTNGWDPEPCCANPPHGYRTSLPSDALSASPLWAFLSPAGEAYAVVAGVFALVAICLGYRGAAILGQAMVILPFRAVWLIIVTAIVVNLYAIASLFGSGALATLASGTFRSATRAWRR